MTSRVRSWAIESGAARASRARYLWRMGLTVERFVGLERPDWLKLRQEDVTASEMGVLFGDYRYVTMLGLYHRKLVGEKDIHGGAVMKRGRVMEPAVAALLGEDLPCLRLSPRTGTYLRGRDTENPHVRIGATKDYQGYADRGELSEVLKAQGVSCPWGQGETVSLSVEMKTVSESAFLAHWKNGPPRGYVLQVATQAMLGEDHGGLLAAMVVSPGLTVRLKLYPVPRVPAAEKAICDAVAAFWRSYDEQKVPPASPDDGKLLGDVYKADPKHVVDLSEEPGWSDLAAERETLRDSIDTLDRRVKEIEVKFKERLKTASDAILPGWKLTWRQNARARPFILDRLTRET